MKKTKANFETPQIITPSDYLQFDPTNTSGAATLQAAINRAYLILDGVCGGQITKSYNITDENDSNYRNEEQWFHAQQAFLLQTQYILSCGFDMSNGSAGYSIGGVSYNENRGNDRKEILDSVLHHLTMGKFYAQTVGVELTTGPNELDYSECGGIGTNDPFYPWFKYVTYDVGDKRYVTYSQPNAKVGNVAMIDENHNVIFAPMNISGLDSIKVLDWTNARIEAILHLDELINSEKMLVTSDYVSYQISRLEQLIHSMTPEGYEELVAQVQANTEAIGNINDVNEQQNAKIATNTTNITNNTTEINSLDDRVTALEENPSVSIADGVYADTPSGIITLAKIGGMGKNEVDFRLATIYSVDQAIQNSYLHYIRQLNSTNTLYLTNGENWVNGLNYQSALTFTHNNNNNNVLGWKTINNGVIQGSEYMKLEGAQVEDDQIINEKSVINKRYVDNTTRTIAQFLSQKPNIKYEKKTGIFYVYIPETWAQLPDQYWSKLSIVPVYYTNRRHNFEYGQVSGERFTYAKPHKLSIMCAPNGIVDGGNKIDFVQGTTADVLSQSFSTEYNMERTFWNMDKCYIKLTKAQVGTWVELGRFKNKLLPNEIPTSFDYLYSFFGYNKNDNKWKIFNNYNVTSSWKSLRWSSAFRHQKIAKDNRSLANFRINMGWAFYQGELPIFGQNNFKTDLTLLGTPTMCNMLFRANWSNIPNIDGPLIDNFNYLALDRLSII